MNTDSWKGTLARHPLWWILSATVALLVTVLAMHWQVLVRDLRTVVQQSTEEANKTLTRVFVNESWDRVRPLLPPAGSGPEAARANPRVPEIEEIVRRFSRTTDVLKVKIYDLDGTTVYSSDRVQIGENKSRNPGFQASARGQVASELTHRGRVSAFDAELHQRDLVSTYVPVRVGDRIEAVLEIYSDRTGSIAFLDQIAAEQAWSLVILLTGAVALMLAGGLVLQHLRARQADAAGLRASADQGAETSAPPVRWLVGADDPIARAVEDLNWEIAALKSASEARDPSSRDTDALGRAQALAEDIHTWIRTAADLTHLTHERQAARRDAFSIDELLDALVALPARKAAGRGVQFGLYKYPATLGAAEGDSARIASLLGHLLGLSVAVTRQGRIDLKVLRTPSGLRIDLIDSSEGWPQQKLDELAEAWDTGTLPSPSEAGLDGLRLVLCRGLAQGLGGHADFRSTPGHGSRLSIDVPLEAGTTTGQ